MRTTLTLDDDILFTAKELAHVEGRTTGEVISDYFRRGLTGSRRSVQGLSPIDEALAELGITRFESRDSMVTNEDVNRLREELAI